MKSRIIVWTLVVIVVIVGLILVLTAPKTSRGSQVTIDTLKSDVALADSQLARLVARAAERRKSVGPGGSSEQLDEADRLLADARDKLDQAQQATAIKEAQQLLMDGREAMRKARRAVELGAKPTSRRSGGY